GTTALTITAFTLDNAGSSAFSLDQAPKTPVNVAPGDFLTLSISYRPTAVGASAGTLRVASNAQNASEGAVALRGSGGGGPGGGGPGGGNNPGGGNPGGGNPGGGNP